MSQWNFYLLTFGCRVNQYETQALRDAWQKQGGQECSQPVDADLICINSCAVTEKGERDARNAVFRMRREAPQARLILTGCAAKFFTAQSSAFEENPDLLLPQAEKCRLLNNPWLDSSLPFSVQERKIFPPFQIASSVRARPVVLVQDGCSQKCTYCIVPLTRGRPVSRAPAEILAEAERLLTHGHAELVLSGVNLRQYGKDQPAYGDFWDLLAYLDRELAPDFHGLARLRISSIEPSQLTVRAVEILQNCKLLCPHLHLSLQHASPTLLRLMGRGHYKPEELLNILAELGKHWPQMGLGCDLILGFPGESEKDLTLLNEFLEALPLSYAHIFPYSVRPGTVASRLPGLLPKEVRRERAGRIRKLVSKSRKAFLERQLTLEHCFMVADGAFANKVPAQIKGVNEYYIPCLLDRGQNWSGKLSGLLKVRPVKTSNNDFLVVQCAK